jgi:PAS domain S-box-containing protein
MVIWRALERSKPTLGASIGEVKNPKERDRTVETIRYITVEPPGNTHECCILLIILRRISLRRERRFRRLSRGGEHYRRKKSTMTRKLESEDTLQIRDRSKREIRQTTEELTRALAIMHATLDATTDGILVTDEQGKPAHFNDKYLAMWKIPRESLEGGTPLAIREIANRSFADPQRFFSRIEEINSTSEESFDVLELKDGRIFERSSKVLYVGGRNAGRVWSFHDATQRYLSEIASRRLASIVASSDDAIIGKDLNSIITSWNDGAERIFGYTAEEIIGASIMRLIPLDRQSEEVEILSRIRSGERVDHFETVRLAKDGRELNISVTVSPIKDSTGHVVGASKVARDITARIKAEAAIRKAVKEAAEANRERLLLLDSEREARSQAERASRMKDEFLATLSHELRTPLNAVVGWTHILRSGKLQVDELREGLDIIERNARVQAQIIEDLLDMSRIISGKVRLELQQMDLPAVLNESIETVRATADAKGIRLNAVGDTSAGSICGDPGRLKQVFWNLLSNAIKFTPIGGQVRVLAKRFNSRIEVSVIDTGEGIAPDFLPYVFDRFLQADASTTRRHGGLGLGLAIVKQLVELHGGYVRAKSKGIGKGATFTVHLPLTAICSELQTEGTPEEKLSLPEVSLTNVEVLIVDDDLDARRLVKRMLEIAGATVSMAASASEAMQRILTARPDVLVCDLGMPDEDGYSLIRRLRILEENQGSALPAIALTAYARLEDRTRAIRSGFQNHLAKPVEPAELLAVVGGLAGRRVATRSRQQAG